MRFAKYMSMLDNRTLFLSSIAHVDDEFEGSLPHSNALLHDMIREWESSTHREARAPESQQVAKGSRRSIVVSCWHRAQHESVAMWKLYVVPRAR